MTERLWTVDDVCNFLGYKRNAVYQLIYRRRIPCIKLSKKAVRFDPVAIRKWLQEKSRDAAPIPHPTAGTYRATGARRGRPRKCPADANIDRLIETVKKEVIG